MDRTRNAARDRISSLLDANSFVEIGAEVTARSTDFNLSAVQTPSDGVVTGYGTVEGGFVYIYAQDSAVLGGRIGEMHARKIMQVYRMARKMGAPVVGLIDCEGVRMEESTDALAALGALLKEQAVCSGLVPQITAVYGACGSPVLPAMSDFTFIVTGPDAAPEDTRVGRGEADLAASEAEVFDEIRRLLSILPPNNEDEGERAPVKDALNRSCEGIGSAAWDAGRIVRAAADDGAFFETRRGFAGSMLTGFIRLNGYTVGVTANNDADGELCADGMGKAARFISFCDAFNIPVLTFAHAWKFRTGAEDAGCVLKEAARLAYAYAGAVVPKVTVVTGRACGDPYVLMGSKALGADLAFAWDGAEIGTADAESAARALCGSADAEMLKDTAGKYAEARLKAGSAARRGYIDTVIRAENTRKYVVGAFEMLCTKREARPDKKHGTV